MNVCINVCMYVCMYVGMCDCISYVHVFMKNSTYEGINVSVRMYLSMILCRYVLLIVC